MNGMQMLRAKRVLDNAAEAIYALGYLPVLDETRYCGMVEDLVAWYDDADIGGHWRDTMRVLEAELQEALTS